MIKCLPQIHRMLLYVCIAIGVACMTHSVALAQQAPEIMTVEAVAKGQHGVGRTVVSGTKIEEFDVEVLGIVRGKGPSESLVLVRASGPLIDHTGGIAAGMSGSPVYIDGKLLGAIAYGFDMADHTLGLVTPAVDMAQVLDIAVDSISQVDPRQGSNGDNRLVPTTVAVSTGRADADHLRAILPADVAVAVPVATPLMVSGLGERAKSLLEPALQRWNVMSVPAGRLIGEQTAPPLEPGSAFGVQLVRGDMELTALGTVTYVSEKGFVGFGHPFLNRGRVDFFVTGAYIHEVVKSLQAPFKVGAPMSAVGYLSQDRGAGVAGHIGGEPEYVNLQVAVNDRSVGRTKQFQAQVVFDESLTAPLVAIALLEAMDRAIDRIGAGTATVKLTIDGQGIPNPITRDNIFFSSSDISAAALSELIMAVQRLLGNDLVSLKPRNISFVVDVEAERRTARIEKAVVHTKQVVPGGVVDVEVSLRPFREDIVNMSMRLPVPKDAPEGDIVVNIRGGGYGLPRILVNEVASQLEGQAPEEEEESVYAIASDLEKFLSDLFDPDLNYELVAEYYPLELGALVNTAPVINDGKGAKAPEGGKSSPEVIKDPKSLLGALSGQEIEPIKTKVATPYYIQGNIQVSFQVSAPPGNTPAETDTNNPEG